MCRIPLTLGMTIGTMTGRLNESPNPPDRQRSPSPLPPGSPSAFRRPGLSRGKDNHTFYMSPSPLSDRGPSPRRQHKKRI